MYQYSEQKRSCGPSVEPAQSLISNSSEETDDVALSGKQDYQRDL
jgi:hypothetical protein